MRSTKKLLNPFNAFFPRVHYPPPLNQRESQRLLNALTTSFRKNLDKEHGDWPENKSSTPTSSFTTAVPDQTSDVLTSQTTHNLHRFPTDRHVRAVLSNPLFSYDPSKVTAMSPAERDPMDVFDQAVSKGLMNLKRAAGVLIAKRDAIAQSSSISVNESMAASGTALRVLQWLRSSGFERDLSFLKFKPLVRNLIPFMVEEGLEEVGWTWLDRYMRGQGPAFSSPQDIMIASHLLCALVRTKLTPGAPLNSGYASIIRAGDMFRENQLFEETALYSWRALCLRSTIFAWQSVRPSEALFDAFAAMSEQLRRLTRTVQIDRAHLDIHHPTHPDATLALKILKSTMVKSLGNYVECDSQAGQKTTADTGGSLSSRALVAKRIVVMATDAAQHLIRIGQEAEAELVGTLVLNNFGTFLRRELGDAGPDLHIFQDVAFMK